MALSRNQYDANRHLVSSTDPLGRTTTYTYRLHGEPDGVPVEELVADRGQDVRGVLDELDRESMLERSEARVRLSKSRNPAP